MFKMMSNSEIIQHLTEQFNEVKEADQDHLAPLSLNSNAPLFLILGNSFYKEQFFFF